MTDSIQLPVIGDEPEGGVRGQSDIGDRLELSKIHDFGSKLRQAGALDALRCDQANVERLYEAAVNS